MKPNEVIVLGLVVFVAIVVSTLWMEHQRHSIAESQVRAFLETQNQTPAVVRGFAGAAHVPSA